MGIIYWREYILGKISLLHYTNCAPLVADLLLFCYKRDFMLSLSDIYQAYDVEAFDSIPQN